MQQKELIIFDMDGTLIDSGNAISNTINFVRNNIGLPTIDKKEILTQMNNPDINAAELFYGTKEFTDEQTVLFGEYYNKHCVSDIILYDGIKEMLDSIESHFTLTIATNASIEFAEKMIKHLNIDNHFEMIIGANCVKNPKPHPDMIIDTMVKLNTNKEKTILIGDSHKDTRAASAANIDSLLVDWGFTDHHREDFAIKTARELTNKLLSFR